MLKRIVLVIFSCVLLSFYLEAQTGTVRGNIFEKESGNPVIYCTVQLAGTKYGTTTDLDGFFVISNVPPGDYRLLATYIGYDSISMPVKVKASAVL